jgi:hypothetical protein
MIVFNLFAMLAYHIAESLSIPCMAVSPYIIPTSSPYWFKSQFAAREPLLFNLLNTKHRVTIHDASLPNTVAAVEPSTSVSIGRGKADEERQGREALDTSVTAGATSWSDVLTRCRYEPRVITWSEVELWMWPLFADHYSIWRQRYLQLSPFPLLDPRTDEPFTCSSPTLSSISDSAVNSLSLTANNSSNEANNDDDDDVLSFHEAARYALPPSCPLIYGMSPSVFARPGYWPSTVELTGMHICIDTITIEQL